MKQLTYLFLVCLLASCSTTKRGAYRKSSKVERDQPGVMAERCALIFPSRDSFSVVKEYIRGRDSLRVDTVTVDCGETSNYGESATIKTRYVRVPCPPCITRVDTVKQSEFERQLNRAAVEAEKANTEEQRKRADKEKERADKLEVKDKIHIKQRNWGWGILLLLAALWAFKKWRQTSTFNIKKLWQR